MMEMEKKLALTDLKAYHQDYKLQKLATNIIKYQNFKTSSIPEEIKKDFTSQTFANYFSQGLRYVRTQCKNPKTPKKLFEFIDKDLKRCVQPLTPSEKDKRLIYQNRRCKSKRVKPVEQPHFDIPKQLTQPFEYGIRKNDKIIVMKDDHTANEFLNNCRSLGIDGVRVVTITVEEEQ